MVLNTSVSKGSSASTSVFSSRYSLLIQINDFNHLLQKTEEYESHDKMPQFFNYGFSASLKTMNHQANDNTYNLKKLLTSFNALVEQGHSIIVIEHNTDVLKSCDWIIDLGPEAGEGGGNLVFAGTPGEMKKKKVGNTGRFL